MFAYGLKTNLRGNVDCSSADTSENLGNDDLCGGSVLRAEGDHEAVAKDIERNAGHHPPFVMASVFDGKGDNDGYGAGGEGEGIGNVSSRGDGIVSNDHKPSEEIGTGEVVDEEVEESQSTGTPNTANGLVIGGNPKVGRRGGSSYVGSAMSFKVNMGLAQRFFDVSHPMKIAEITTPNTIRQIVLVESHGHVPTVPVNVSGTSSIIKPPVNRSKPTTSSSTRVFKRLVSMLPSLFGFGGIKPRFFARRWAMKRETSKGK